MWGLGRCDGLWRFNCGTATVSSSGEDMPGCTCRVSQTADGAVRHNDAIIVHMALM
jgi:hypothetical protein